MAGFVQQNQLGLTLLRKGSWTEAETEFRKALAEAPQQATFHNNLGVALFEQGRTDAAVVEYQQAIQLNDSDTLFHMNLGDAYHRQGKLNPAIDTYRRVLRDSPGRVGIHVRYINVSFDLGTTDGGVADLEALLKQEKLSGIDGINLVYGAEQAIALAHILHGRYEEAEQHVSRALENLSKVKTESGGYVIPIITPFFFYIQTVPKTQINLDRLYASLYNLRGVSQYRRGRYVQAIDDFKQGIDKAQGGNWNFNLGRVLLDQGNTAEALYHFRRFLETSPNSSISRVYAAIALKMSGQDADAERERQEALAQAQNKINSSLRSNYEYVEALALADQSWGRIDEAIIQYQKVIEVAPHAGWAYKKLAGLYHARGNSELARQMIMKALERLPDDVEVQRLSREIVPSA